VAQSGLLAETLMEALFLVVAGLAFIAAAYLLVRQKKRFM
jgi:LPXTG-motif cell wall-anchored protein